jgi:hypothetical protein
MYTVSDIIEVGTAQEVIMGHLKDWWILDDASHLSMAVEPPW